MPMPEHQHHAHHPPKDGLVMRIAKSSAITSFIAGSMLLAGIPLATVLPTSAPIWMGFAALFSKR